MKENLVYLILVLLFIIVMYLFISGYDDGAAVVEALYAQEIVHVINTAPEGAAIALDVSPLTAIAVKHHKDPHAIIRIDNVNNYVTVSLRNGGGERFSFFRNIDIINPRIELISGGTDINRFIFTLRAPSPKFGGAI